MAVPFGSECGKPRCVVHDALVSSAGDQIRKLLRRQVLGCVRCPEQHSPSSKLNGFPHPQVVRRPKLKVGFETLERQTVATATLLFRINDETGHRFGAGRA